MPNCGLKVKTEGGRIGRNASARAAVQTKKEPKFHVNVPQLFNSLPAYIGNLTKCDLGDFKMKQDKFLEQTPDEPNVAGLTPGGSLADARPSNSILDQVRRVQIVWIFYIYVLFYSTDKWLQSNSFGDDAQNLPKKKKIFNFPWISVSQDFNFSEFQFLCISVSPGFSVFVFQCHPLLL